MNKIVGRALLILLVIFGESGQSFADELQQELRKQIDQRAEQLLADENNAGLH